MATTLSQGDIIEASYNWIQGVQRGVNVIHYRVSATSTAVAQLSEVATALQTAIGTLALTIVPPAVTAFGVALQLISPLPKSVKWSGGELVGPGTYTGTPAAKQISAVITKLSVLGGRANRGRTYVPFPSKDAEDTDGTPTAAYLEAIQDLYDGLLGTLVVSTPGGIVTLKCIIWHRLTSSYTDVTALRYNDKFGTQRRRGDYGKPG